MPFSDFALFATLVPQWMPWGLSHVTGALSTIDPWIIYPSLLASSLSCLAVKHAPPRLRFWCAAPCLPSGALFCWVALSFNPAFLALMPLALCPLALWVASPRHDEMRAELTEADGGA